MANIASNPHLLSASLAVFELEFESNSGIGASTILEYCFANAEFLTKLNKLLKLVCICANEYSFIVNVAYKYIKESTKNTTIYNVNKAYHFFERQ